MRNIIKGALALGVAAAALATPASASHSWGNYHWARPGNPFTLKLGDNVDSNWDSYLAVASTDWSASTVLDTTIVAGGTTGRRCRATAGRIEVCNAAYGQNGWLGLASISANGDHITQATVKLNDSYYNMAQYNTPAWRQMVMCQEVGHDFGLDHQDTNQTNPNLGTCMDYTSNPSGPPSNLKPNQHDYDQLVTIYGHGDSSTTIGMGINGRVADIGDTPATWGRPVHFLRDGRPDTYMRLDGPGAVTLTHVVWAIGEGPRGR